MSERNVASFRLPARSLGLKLLLVCLLGFVMSLAALAVFLLLYDRTHRAEEVSVEVGSLVGGRQTFLGPVLAVPYSQPAKRDPDVKGPQPAFTYGVHIIYPAHGSASADSRSQVRQRSLFRVPVWTADLDFKADFDLAGAENLAPSDAILDWSRAEFLVGASDARGAQSDVTLTTSQSTSALVPAATLSDIAVSGIPAPASDYRSGMGGGGESLRFFGISAAGVAKPGAKFSVSAHMKFTGAQRLTVLAFAKTTDLAMRGDWPSPSFDGGFLPKTRNVDAKGFSAAWTVPFIARGVPAGGEVDTISRLGPTALGVSFVEPANPYQSAGRSLKYAPLFMGLVFLAYFLFETTRRRRVHPAQYLLIGMAQTVFYLLLLSIAERIGFDAAFLVAAGSTVALISAYAGWVFESRRQGLIALAAFSLLYVLIYLLMRLEDLALLIGAFASFAAIAAAMFFTRRVDWYGAVAEPTPSATANEDPANGSARAS